MCVFCVWSSIWPVRQLQYFHKVHLWTYNIFTLFTQDTLVFFVSSSSSVFENFNFIQRLLWLEKKKLKTTNLYLLYMTNIKEYSTNMNEEEEECKGDFDENVKVEGGKWERRGCSWWQKTKGRRTAYVCVH